MKTNKNTEYYWIATIVAFFAGSLTSLLLAVLSVYSLGCTPKRQEIQFFYDHQGSMGWLASAAHAKDIGGKSYEVAPTGSMEPYLTGGDFIVVKPIPYDLVQQGMLGNYQARWRKPTDPTVTHWVAAKLGDEWIMDGQANSSYENSPSQLMGRAEWRGQVVAVYTKRSAP